MNEGNDAAKVLKEPGDVTRVMGDLNTIIGEVLESVSALEADLVPVTGPIDPAVNEPCPEEVMVPLASDIRQALRSVQLIQQRLNTLRSLIQL